MDIRDTAVRSLLNLCSSLRGLAMHDNFGPCRCRVPSDERNCHDTTRVLREALDAMLPHGWYSEDNDYDCGAFVLRVVRGEIVDVFLPRAEQWIVGEIHRSEWVQSATAKVEDFYANHPTRQPASCGTFFRADLRESVADAIEILKIWRDTAFAARAVDVPLLVPLTRRVPLGKGTCGVNPPKDAVAYRGGGESSYVVFYTIHGKATCYRVGGTGGRPEIVPTSLTSLRHKYATFGFEDRRLRLS